jgi:hypothetical protein
MKKVLGFVKHKLSFLAAVTLAAVVGGASTAVVMAAIPDGNGVIHACYRNSAGLLDPKGNLRIIDDASDSCTGQETSLIWDQESIDNPVYSKVATVPLSSSPTTLFILPGFGDIKLSQCLYNPSEESFDRRITYTNTTSHGVNISQTDGGVVAPNETATIDIANVGGIDAYPPYEGLATGASYMLSYDTGSTQKTVTLSGDSQFNLVNNKVTGCSLRLQAVMAQ